MKIQLLVQVQLESKFIVKKNSRKNAKHKKTQDSHFSSKSNLTQQLQRIVRPLSVPPGVVVVVAAVPVVVVVLVVVVAVVVEPIEVGPHMQL
jgi:hypothetical protein